MYNCDVLNYFPRQHFLCKKFSVPLFIGSSFCQFFGLNLVMDDSIKIIAQRQKREQNFLSFVLFTLFAFSFGFAKMFTTTRSIHISGRDRAKASMPPPPLQLDHWKEQGETTRESEIEKFTLAKGEKLSSAEADLFRSAEFSFLSGNQEVFPLPNLTTIGPRS